MVHDDWKIFNVVENAILVQTVLLHRIVLEVL